MQTATAVSSKEVDSDIEDLAIDSLTRDYFQEENTCGNVNSDALEDIAPPEDIQSVLNDACVEDFKLKSMLNFSYEMGHLHLLCQLDDGNVIGTPFDELKKEYSPKPQNTHRNMSWTEKGRFSSKMGVQSIET